MEKLLNELTGKLQAAAADNLRTVVLYGSAASGEFRSKHSDLNVLCLLKRVNPAELSRLHGPAKWWVRKGHPAPLLFTLEELEQAADLYAIELVEIKNNRRMLYGDDVFAEFDVPMTLHRLQVERELRHNLIRLRQGYVAVGHDRKKLALLMVRSASTFGLLFRHALMALREEAPPAKIDAVEKLAALLGFDAASFRTLFQVRAGGQKEKDLDAQAVFKDYLEAVTRAVDELDKRFD